MIVRRNYVLGPLWSTGKFLTKGKPPPEGNLRKGHETPAVKRLIFDGISLGRETTGKRPAEPGLVTVDFVGTEVHMDTCDGKTVVIARAKVDGGVEKPARKALPGLKWSGKLICR